MIDLLKIRKEELEEALDRMDSKRMAEVLAELGKLMWIDGQKWKNNHIGVAARRLRRYTRMIEKIGPRFRRQSLKESKELRFIE